MPQGPTPFPQGLYAPLLYLKPIPFASLPTHPQVGMQAAVSDSTVSAAGATIAGGGTNKVSAVYNGTNWVVDIGTGGNVAVAGYLDYNTAWALTAVGTSRSNALALTAQVNQVTTAASSAVGVILPPSATVGVGGFVRVYNDGPSNSFHVYAAGSDTIDGTAGSTGVALTNAFYCDYFVSAAGAFVSYRTAFTRST